MKSAYELAMERLQKEDPDGVKSLNDEQRQQLDEIEKRYTSKIAEREIFLRETLAKAEAHERQQIEEQIVNERERLKIECEAEKDKIRNQST